MLEPGPWDQSAGFRFWLSHLASSVTLGKLFSLPTPQFLFCKKEVVRVVFHRVVVRSKCQVLRINVSVSVLSEMWAVVVFIIPL